jgi:hypothetical protein
MYRRQSLNLRKATLFAPQKRDTRFPLILRNYDSSNVGRSLFASRATFIWRSACRRFLINFIRVRSSRTRIAGFDVDWRSPRRPECGWHEGAEHFNLETAVELGDVVNLDALPVDRFNVPLKASLHTPSN